MATLYGHVSAEGKFVAGPAPGSPGYAGLLALIVGAIQQSESCDDTAAGKRKAAGLLRTAAAYAGPLDKALVAEAQSLQAAAKAI